MIEIVGVVVKSKECPQGLKPCPYRWVMSELKFRPSKEHVRRRGERPADEALGAKTRLRPCLGELRGRRSWPAATGCGRSAISAMLAVSTLFAMAMVFTPRLHAQQAAAPQGAQQAAQPVTQLTPDQAERAKSLGKRVKCMCGGCDDAAGTCTHSGGAFAGPCDTAKAELKEIDARVARGDSDDLILQSFVQEYGPTVLIEPPKSGFNWLAWIMPVAFPLVALFLVWQVVRRWHRRAALAPASGPPLPAELLERARQEADKESDE